MSKGVKMLQDQFGPYIKWKLIYNGASPDEANEILHEGLIAVYQKIQKSEVAYLKTYFTRICLFKWYDRIKMSNENTSHVELAETQNLETSERNPFEEIRYQEDASLLENLWLEWSPDCSLIFEEHYKNGKSYQEIGEILKLSSPGATRQKWYKCKKKLFRIVLENKVYLNFVLQLLHENEIKRCFLKYAAEIDLVWGFVCNRLRSEVRVKFKIRLQKETDLNKLVAFLESKRKEEPLSIQYDGSYIEEVDPDKLDLIPGIQSQNDQVDWEEGISELDSATKKTIVLFGGVNLLIKRAIGSRFGMESF